MSPLRSKLLFSAAALAALAAAPSDVWAAKIKIGAVVVEGTITDITGNIVTINSIPIDVSTAQIHTPTAVKLTVSDLVSTSMPGWPGPGLIGAHAVAQGNTSYQTQNNTMVALDLFTDVGETPIVGAATSLPPSTADLTTTDVFKVENVPVDEIPATNGVMPGDPPQNIYGFDIFVSSTSIPAGTAVALQGYYSQTDQKFYYYSLQADSGTLKNPATHEISVTKALCQSGKLTLIGAVHSPSTGSVNLTWTGNGVTGTATGVGLKDVGVTNPTIGQYKWTGDASKSATTACPLTLTVTHNELTVPKTGETIPITPR
jgi:hypothetical protein